MKVIVQIPCLNEEETLPLVMATMPRQIPGVDMLEYLVIDDGSTDRTVEVARQLGVHHILRHRRNMGLARAFRDGVYYALEQGADIVVNTDGDNQYPQEMIPQLIQPIMEGRAEIVVADRQTHLIEHFSPLKKLLQRFGSSIVNRAAGTDLPDAASGFRAYSKQALFQLNIITQFSYTMETIIQAGNKRIAITSVPITTNPKTRESRLFKNMWQHVLKSASAIIRAFIMYKPRVVFASLAGVFFVAGLVPFLRFLYFAVVLDDPDGHLQSLLLGAVFMIAAFLSAAMGVIADLIHINRTLHEETLEQIKAQRFGRRAAPRDAAKGKRPS